MPLLLNNPAHWHLRAQEARLLALHLKDPEANAASRSRMNTIILQKGMKASVGGRSDPRRTWPLRVSGRRAGTSSARKCSRMEKQS